MRCRRSRWTRGWSRWPTTLPTGCASTAASPPATRTCSTRTIAFAILGSVVVFALFGALPALDALLVAARVPADRPGGRASRRSRSSATSRSSSRGSSSPTTRFISLNVPTGVLVLYGLLMLRLRRRRALPRARCSTSGRCAASARARDARSVLIVGAGDGGRLLLREILRNPDLGLRPVGFVDDDPRKQGARIDRGVRVLGDDRRAGAGARRRRARRGADRDPVGAGHAARQRRDARAASAACRCARCRRSSSCCRPAGGMIRQVREVRVEDVLGREPVRMEVERVGGYLTRPRRAGHRRRRVDRLRAVPPDRARRRRAGSCCSTTPRTTCSRSSASWSRTATRSTPSPCSPTARRRSACGRCSPSTARRSSSTPPPTSTSG